MPRLNEMGYKRSVCPHDCPDACGLLVGVEEGRVVSVKGDPDHPFTRGAICEKVKHYGERVHSPLRIHHPLKRVGPKGSGKFERVSWEQALNEIVGRYKAIISDFGSEAILPYSYAGTMGVVQFHAGHPFFHKLGASRLKRTICSAAAEAGFSASMGFSIFGTLLVFSVCPYLFGKNGIGRRKGPGPTKPESPARRFCHAASGFSGSIHGKKYLSNEKVRTGKGLSLTRIIPRQK